MSLFGSLFTGVSGLGAQSQSTAMIANNIANVNTVGFKRSEASFFSLVTTEGRSSQYSPGTVSVNRVQRVDLQGPIQQTSSATDAAISGNGFFTVKREASNEQEFLYTRSGSFSEDSQGLLRNTAGFVLYGWPLDSAGGLPANQGDLTSLVPVDVAFLGGLTRPTSTAELSLNLDASEGDENLVDATDDLVNPHFSRGLTVFDSLGQSQVLTFEFTKNYGPHATAGGTINDLLATDNLVTDLGLTAGNTFEVSSELGGPLALTIVAGAPAVAGEVQTINDIITEINNAGIGVEAFLGNDGELVIQRDEFFAGAANTLTLENTGGTPLTSLGITLAPNPQTFLSDDLTGAAGPNRTTNLDNSEPGDNPPYSNEMLTDLNTFPAFQFIPGDASYNNRGWWQLNVVHPNGTSLSRGLINFNSDGSLNARPDGNGNIDLNLAQIDWGNGSEAQNIDVDIERFSQFSGNYDVIFSDQNGAELGLRTGNKLVCGECVEI